MQSFEDSLVEFVAFAGHGETNVSKVIDQQARQQGQCRACPAVGAALHPSRHQMAVLKMSRAEPFSGITYTVARPVPSIRCTTCS